ncbi:NUDIX domain-containing protein [Natronosalvus caseinilyticus]|uniref:NUDIX domain-containing protein n=1 Tax=Natronosalvus caseinilyticus TaxID=2953747 RepID=UPI0028ABBAC6|nr:NUDIX domain-containing protein [Natronosalvus caseinilyticus]
MGNEPPTFCHYCGEELTPVDPPTVHRCAACGEHVFYNPSPCSRVAVVDGESILLVKVDLPERDMWGTPGGMVEAGEDPDEAGARELAEETTLTVDPDDLVLFDVRTFAKFETVHKTYLVYAVDVADVHGTPRADDEVAAARFWTPAELEAARDELLTSWPTEYRDLRWWVDSARAALDRGRDRS